MGWFEKLKGAMSNRAAEVLGAGSDTGSSPLTPRPQNPQSSAPVTPAPPLTLPPNMGVRNELAGKVEAVLKRHPDVVDVVVGCKQDGGRSQICMKAVVRSHTVLIDDLETYCERHPSLNSWFSHFSISEVVPLDGPGPLGADEKLRLGEFLSLEPHIPRAMMRSAGYHGSTRDAAAIRRFLSSDDFENLLEVGQRYKRLRDSMEMVSKTYQFLSPETRARLPKLDPNDFACLDAYEATGQVAAWTSEAFVALPLREEMAERARRAARHDLFAAVIASVEKEFADIHARLDLTLTTFDKDAPKIRFRTIIGKMAAKEITLVQYALIGSKTRTLEAAQYNDVLKTALSKHPWQFAEDWSPTSPSAMEAKAGFMALTEKHLKRQSLDEDYAKLVNMMHRVAQEEPDHPLVSWFNRRSGGGTGGWATSR